MRILINAGFFNKTPNADNNIEITLAKTFVELGHGCEIVGATYQLEPETMIIDGITVHKVPYVKPIVLHAVEEMRKRFKTDGTTRISGKEKLLFGLRHPIYTIVMQLNKSTFFKERMTSDYKTEVKKILEKESYDTLIGTVFSFEQTELLFLDESITLPKVYYQLDPFGLYEAKTEEEKEKDKIREARVMGVCEKVFTTRELLEEYEKEPLYQPLMGKMCAVGFPTFLNTEKQDLPPSPITFDPSEINILFSGTIDDIHRNPIKTFEILRRIMECHTQVHFYILGYFDSPLGKEYLLKHNLRITVVRAVSFIEALSAMNQADILLNIGNTDLNMVPSKLFTSFALGKPLINIQRQKESPAGSYIRKYPLAYTLTEDPTSDQVQELETFILNGKNKKESYESIERIFEEFTPHYVANQMLKEINNPQE